jgi:hypothetical protein
MALEGIVEAYVKLRDRRALRELRTRWRRMAMDLKARAGGPYDLSPAISEVQNDLAAIEAGLEGLSANGESPSARTG